MVKIDEKFSTRALSSLLKHCSTDNSLRNDKDIQVIINTSKKMGIKNDHIPRIIPLRESKLRKPKDLRILLITKDPSTSYREALAKDESTTDLFKEILSVKNVKRRYRGVKSIQLYKEFDLIVADFRVHHLLPDVLGSKFYHGSKKLPYVIRMTRPSDNSKTSQDCDPVFVRAQLKNICKNTSYVPNSDNCLGIRIGLIGKHNTREMVENIKDVIAFLTDKSKRPQGGVIKGGISSIFVKTTNSPSLPIYGEQE
ncbi:putative subunit of U3-containing 90S preribosome complex [Zygosaccharomyces mellis]|uniref:Putative subunit of U3-containing 90S preribosome complex n=1 Tax=Zygosaccharomyces mellis TaxID=42258 RepID=A0A4C2E0N6_9SACH|nr:putative subunit of U3-containing 90S preribosome complex [Zygosaccharomyces mellis]